MQKLAARSDLPISAQPVFSASLERDAVTATEYFGGVEAQLRAAMAARKDDRQTDTAALKAQARGVKEQFFAVTPSPSTTR